MTRKRLMARSIDDIWEAEVRHSTGCHGCILSCPWSASIFLNSCVEWMVSINISKQLCGMEGKSHDSMFLGIWMYLLYMGVSKNSGTPKWMVYNGKPY